MSTKFIRAVLIIAGVFAVGCVWLVIVLIRGNQTFDWKEITATVVKVEVDGEPGRGIRGWATKVRYRAEGKEYESIVNEYYAEKNVRVFINPNDPTLVVANQGPQVEHLAAPILAIGGSALSGVVLILIAISTRTGSGPAIT